MASPLLIDVVTLFPEMFSGALEHSILARAQASGIARIALHDLRSHGIGPHRQVDDAPFGGGGGMVLKPEPLFACVESITGRPAGARAAGEAVILLTPAGEPFDQACARRLAGMERLVIVCGRYEGVDERVRTTLATEAVSVGDFVLSGGEPAALCVIDAVVRLLPGALGNPEGSVTESHEDGLLEAPHFTRPASFRGLPVPEPLLSGNHAGIALWRRHESLRLAARLRPDLIERARAKGQLSRADEAFLHTLSGEDGPSATEGDPSPSGETDAAAPRPAA
jgi:tRNA (guanine37-N1)-methyltransferase